MPRIGNARTIADIEYVIDPPSAGSTATSWQAHGAHCTRDQHRFSGQTYSFSFEVLDLRFEGPPRQKWRVMIVSELWKFSGARGEPRGTKTLKLIHGKAADVLSWMRRCRDQKVNETIGKGNR